MESFYPFDYPKTDKGIPRYQDAEESDTFILSGTKDLVPSLKPYERDEDSSQPVLSGDKLFEDCDWLFEVVFDYGEHDLDNPGVDEARQWPCRPDPFSGYRATNLPPLPACADVQNT